MTTPEDVLELFGQLYQAEQQLALNIERERVAKATLEGVVRDVRDAETALTALRERMARLARKAAGVPEPEPDRERRLEFQPVRRY